MVSPTKNVHYTKMSIIPETRTENKKAVPCAQGRLTYNGTPSGEYSLCHFERVEKSFQNLRSSEDDLLERKTRLELATPTLARLCSTN